MTSPGMSPTTSPLVLYPATPTGSPLIAQHAQWNMPNPGFTSRKMHPMYIPVIGCYNYTNGSVQNFPLSDHGITVGSLCRQLYLASRGIRARDLHVRSFDGGHLGNHVQLAAGDRVMVSLPMQVHVAGCGMVKCWPHDPVIVLQRAVESRCGVPVDDQILLYNGKVLQPPSTRLCSFGLRHGSGVAQSGRLRAGVRSHSEAIVQEVVYSVACGSGDVDVPNPWLVGSSTQKRCGRCRMLLCEGRCLDCDEQLAKERQIIDQLSWSTRKYLYSATAISEREFDGAMPYTQNCINRYIDGLNAVHATEPAARTLCDMVMGMEASANELPVAERGREGVVAPDVAMDVEVMPDELPVAERELAEDENTAITDRRRVSVWGGLLAHGLCKSVSDLCPNFTSTYFQYTSPNPLFPSIASQ